ncbi:MAG: acyltransferase family protein [Solirubrobacterales bacterium]|nr:acyltransferase family protein [Solirubrobacterales bacterium]
MPRPIAGKQRYMPGLDGLRAIAVLAVIAYHLDADWAQGGLLGVAVFFTLSGYLITDLLLSRWVGHKLKLGYFWLARARRLLPALFLMLIVVLAWVWIADPERLDQLRGEAISSSLFVSNWWMIFQDASYFERFGPVSPLSHLWSLAVEEQFYIFWPWLLLGGLWLFKGTRNGKRQDTQPALALATLGLGLVSVVLMLALYKPGFDTTRVYEGTDTRAFGLLFGAALAMVWPSRLLTRTISEKARNLLDFAGIGGLLVIALLIWATDDYSPFIYRGGLVMLTIATVVVVAVLAHPASRLGVLMGVLPLRWIGVRSYGIYLWQLPIIGLTTPADSQGLDPVRALVQVAAVFVIAALSWKFVEDPIRHGAMGPWLRKIARSIRDKRMPDWSVKGRIVAGVSLLVGLLAFLSLAGLTPSGPVAPLAVTASAEAEKAKELEQAVSTTRTGSGEPVADGDTACAEVAYIGDSTSVGLLSPDYLPRPEQRIDALLADKGIETQRIDIDGARSIVEKVEGQLNAEEAAQLIRDDGFDGCWILALGTNESANVAVGSTISEKTRIDTMMDVAAGDPVLWVNVKSIVSGTPYDAANMEGWNRALLDACPSWPNMRIYDWYDQVREDWFVTDGIHFTSEGYANRARMIADALAEAFPPDWEPDGPVKGRACLVKAPKAAPIDESDVLAPLPGEPLEPTPEQISDAVTWPWPADDR